MSATKSIFGEVADDGAETEVEGGVRSDSDFATEVENLPVPPPKQKEDDVLPDMLPPKISTGMSAMMERLSPTKSRRGSTSTSGGNQSTVMFMHPEEGTPAAAALAANAELKMSKTDKILHKFRGMKRPKLKALNVMKQLKKHTKVKGRKKYKNFKGKVIDGEHELYVITAGIILGIRCSLENARMESLTRATRLTLGDFNYVENVAFPAGGSDNMPYPTPPHSLQRTFKFKSYAPRVFSRLRDLVDINADDYLESICGNYNFIEFMSNSKSGQFFFYSHDGKYMLKTQTKEENKFMKLILPHYYRYLAENPQSLLVRFLGMHRVKMYQFRRKVHFVIMTSVFNTPEEIHKIYDLKGSTIGRAATAKEKASGGVMKDLDLIDSGEKFHLGRKRSMLLDQLDKDAAFLATLGIMDYSLLIGIHYRSRRQRIPNSLPVSGSGANSPGGRRPGSERSERVEAEDSANEASEEAAGSQDSSDMAAVAAGMGGDGRAVMPMTSHSNTPLRRALAAESDTHSRRASLVAQRTGSVIMKGGRKGSGKKWGGEISTGRGATGAAEEEDVSDDTDSQFSEDTDVGSVTDEMIHQAESHASQGRAVFYSDTEGLQSAEGERLSQILSLHGSESPTIGGTRKRLGLKSYRALESLSNRRIVIRLGQGEDNEAKTNAGTYLRDDGDSDEEDSDGDASKGKDKGTGVDTGARIAVANPAAGSSSLGLENEDLPRPLADSSSRVSAAPKMRFDARHPWTTRRDLGINSRMAGITDQRGDEIYYCGVIDILQLYNMHKSGETILKGLIGYDTSKISSVDPQSYAKRFIEFLEDHTD